MVVLARFFQCCWLSADVSVQIQNTGTVAGSKHAQANGRASRPDHGVGAEAVGWAHAVRSARYSFIQLVATASWHSLWCHGGAGDGEQKDDKDKDKDKDIDKTALKTAHTQTGTDGDHTHTHAARTGLGLAPTAQGLELLRTMMGVGGGDVELDENAITELLIGENLDANRMGTTTAGKVQSCKQVLCKR